jgi:hypothetical protein
VQGDAGRKITGDFGFTKTIVNATSGAFYKEPYGENNVALHTQTGSKVFFDASRVVPTAPEIRPVNTAVRYLIRAFP